MNSTLPVPEAPLPHGGEDFRDRHTGGGDDLGIRVVKRRAEQRCKALADARLAGSHQPDQHHTPSKRRRIGLHLRDWLTHGKDFH